MIHTNNPSFHQRRSEQQWKKARHNRKVWKQRNTKRKHKKKKKMRRQISPRRYQNKHRQPRTFEISKRAELTVRRDPGFDHRGRRVPPPPRRRRRGRSYSRSRSRSPFAQRNKDGFQRDRQMRGKFTMDDHHTRQRRDYYYSPTPPRRRRMNRQRSPKALKRNHQRRDYPILRDQRGSDSRRESESRDIMNSDDYYTHPSSVIRSDPRKFIATVSSSSLRSSVAHSQSLDPSNSDLPSLLQHCSKRIELRLDDASHKLREQQARNNHVAHSTSNDESDEKRERSPCARYEGPRFRSDRPSCHLSYNPRLIHNGVSVKLRSPKRESRVMVRFPDQFSLDPQSTISNNPSSPPINPKPRKFRSVFGLMKSHLQKANQDLESEHRRKEHVDSSMGCRINSPQKSVDSMQLVSSLRVPSNQGSSPTVTNFTTLRNSGRILDINEEARRIANKRALELEESRSLRIRQRLECLRDCYDSLGRLVEWLRRMEPLQNMAKSIRDYYSQQLDDHDTLMVCPDSTVKSMVFWKPNGAFVREMPAKMAEMKRDSQQRLHKVCESVIWEAVSEAAESESAALHSPLLCSALESRLSHFLPSLHQYRSMMEDRSVGQFPESSLLHRLALDIHGLVSSDDRLDKVVRHFLDSKPK